MTSFKFFLFFLLLPICAVQVEEEEGNSVCEAHSGEELRHFIGSLDSLNEDHVVQVLFKGMQGQLELREEFSVLCLRQMERVAHWL